jgi:transposase
VLGADGAVAGRFSFAHHAAAIRTMVRRLHAAGVARVAIERGDGPVVEELLAAGLAVFVVPSRQIKGLRTRYGSAGNKDDRFDAYVLADTLRTDGHRWKPLRPDTEPTRALRALCRSRKGLVETRVQVIGQLRANLELAFPGAIGLFTKPASAISLALLRRFPTAVQGRVAEIAVLDAEIARAFAAHPDRHIFASLADPGSERHHTDSPMTQRPGFGPHQQPSLPLIQVREDRPELRRQRLPGSLRHAHSTS